jgi:hypothetical protein
MIAAPLKMQMLGCLLPVIMKSVRHAPRATVNAMQLCRARTMSRCASWSSPRHTPRERTKNDFGGLTLKGRLRVPLFTLPGPKNLGRPRVRR